MKLNASQRKAAIAHRRQMVAGLYLRGMSQRDIQLALRQKNVVNPETGKPYSLGTINSDIKRLYKDWVKSASRDYGEAKARHLAEIREARRVAWRASDLPMVSKLLRQESDLMGLNSVPGDTEDNPYIVKILRGVSMDDI